MEIVQNIVEYYDELYPVTEAQKKFYESLSSCYEFPVHFLRIGCGTGLFEHTLAKSGHDVTGIETYPEYLRSANLRRRNQLMSVRFFQMSTIDMSHFLGKNFYNIISCLDDRVLFINDRTLMRKFFFDCKQLLVSGGTLILSLTNMAKDHGVPLKKLQNRESLRVKLFSEIWTDDAGQKFYNQNLETGSGKVVPVRTDVPVYSLVPDELIEYAKEAGFSNVELFADFDCTPFTGSEDNIVAKIQ